ncbi:hypothetical protein CP532_5121 [Ophiocordyceps camponoti-leonardi (nom. inval.)]|nr:hypothetical protein CP532_5121 [Ophiocordyceps camponoti-leonardi (nom. inval.)]
MEIRLLILPSVDSPVKFLGDATPADGFWAMMLEKPCATSDFPADHVKADGFNSEAPRGENKMNSACHSYHCMHYPQD